MLGDVFNKLSAAQTLTASAVSTNVIDLLARKDIAPGYPFGMVFTVDVTPTAAYDKQTAGFSATNATDLFTLNAHGLLVGDMVTLDGTTAPTGLEFGRIYFVTNPTANTFQISTTLAVAKSGVADALFTSDGTSISLTVHPTVECQIVVGDLSTLAETNRPLQVIGTSGPVPLRMPRRTAATAATDILTTTAHGLETGMPIVLSVSGAGVLPAATPTLVAGQVYYAIVASTSTFKLALTPQDAAAGIAVDITGTGTQPYYWQVYDTLLTAGKALVKVDANLSNEVLIPNRYLGARYIVGGKLTTPAMAVSAMPVIGGAYPVLPATYPSGWSV
ncbi:MAG: hypothetical protein KA129_04535 [Microthrixaceae bacterium]|nr:hypothetical protein [Microthrixaceae bacterium]